MERVRPGGWMEGWRDGGVEGWMEGWMDVPREVCEACLRPLVPRGPTKEPRSDKPASHDEYLHLRARLWSFICVRYAAVWGSALSFLKIKF